jgi:NAD(P)H-hydrate epimerase
MKSITCARGGGVYTRAMVSRIPEDSAAPPPPPPADDRERVYVLDARSLREVDRLASEEFGIPSIVLMENAAFHIADVALHVTGQVAAGGGPRVLIVCGPGNNGGDGLAAARHLHNAGAKVEIVMTVPEGALAGDAAVNAKIARSMGLPMTVIDTGRPGAAVREALERLGGGGGGGGADLIIDALLGTGLRQAVREPIASVIVAINRLAREHEIPVLAVDIPSGLDADSGEPLGETVHASVTVSMVGLKTGFTTLSAQAYIGDVVVVDIGSPPELTARLGTPLTDQELAERFGHQDENAGKPERAPSKHKRLGDGD